MAASRHTHASCNAVLLEWGSLRLAPIIQLIFLQQYFSYCCAVGPPLNAVAEVATCGYLKGESHIFIFSKKSNNGPSEKQTTSLQQTDDLPPIDFTIELVRFKPPGSGHLNSVQQTLMSPDVPKSKITSKDGQ